MSRVILSVVFILFGARLTALARVVEPMEGSSNRVSITGLSIKVGDILGDLHKLYDVSFVYADEVADLRCNLRLTNCPWQDALDVTLHPRGYQMVLAPGSTNTYVISPLPETENRHSAGKIQQERELTGVLLFLSMLPTLLAGVALLPLLLVHVILSIAIFSDARKIKTTVLLRPSLWSLVTLVGGLMAMLLYWLIHHSRLARKDQQPPIAA